MQIQTVLHSVLDTAEEKYKEAAHMSYSGINSM